MNNFLIWESYTVLYYDVMCVIMSFEAQKKRQSIMTAFIKKIQKPCYSMALFATFVTTTSSTTAIRKTLKVGTEQQQQQSY